MRNKVLLCIALSIVLEFAVSIAFPTASRAFDENERCGCLIVGVLGKAYVKPARSPRFIPLKVNMAVFGGSNLHITESSKAMLACGTATRELTSGVHPVPCTPGDPSPIWMGTRIVDPSMIRGPVPRLLSPRRGALLNAHPTFRWTSVASVAQYSVVVRGGNVDWSAIVKSTEIVYPNTAPPLVPGPAYKVTIFAARGGSSDDEGVTGLEFRILSAPDAEKVKARETEIKSLNLEAASKQLLIAYLYASYDLIAEAITVLKDASAADQESSRALAELYIKSLLLDKAEEQYSKVVEMATEDTPGRAAAYDRLGQIYEASHKKDQAMQKYQNALKLYVDLEDWNKVSEFAIKLSKLQKP